MSAANSTDVLSSAAANTTLPTPSPYHDTVGWSTDLEIRLWVTVVCSTVSIVCCALMFRGYRRFRAYLSNDFNDLYVLGLGTFQTLQALQYAAFAAVHLALRDTFSGTACIVSAVLDQFLDFGSLMFALGFFHSLITLRWRMDCCGARTYVSGSGGTLASRGSQRSRDPSGAALPTVGSEALGEEAATTRLLSGARNGRGSAVRGSSFYLVVDDGEKSPEGFCSLRCCGAQTSAAGPDRFVWSRLLWPCVAAVGGIVTVVVMCVYVVHDPDENPLPLVSHNITAQNFEVGLGWCWIPNGHRTLRLLCSYLWSALVVIAGIVAFAVLYHYEHGYSVAMHLPVYIRLVILVVFLTITYGEGAVARFLEEHGTIRYSKIFATAMYCLFGAVVSISFMASERILLSSIRRNPHDVPGNGFSTCVNHLLIMEVNGVPLPATAETFASSLGRGRFVSSQEGADSNSDLRTQHAMQEEPNSSSAPSTMYFLHAYDSPNRMTRASDTHIPPSRDDVVLVRSVPRATT